MPRDMPLRRLVTFTGAIAIAPPCGVAARVVYRPDGADGRPTFVPDRAQGRPGLPGGLKHTKII